MSVFALAQVFGLLLSGQLAVWLGIRHIFLAYAVAAFPVARVVNADGKKAVLGDAAMLLHVDVLVSAEPVKEEDYASQSRLLERAGGDSLVAGPDGELLIRVDPADQPGMALFDLNRDALEASRRAEPYFENRRPDLYSRLVNSAEG